MVPQGHGPGRGSRRYTRLHGSGATQRRAGRRPHRPIYSGCRDFRDAHGNACFCRQYTHGGLPQDALRATSRPRWLCRGDGRGPRDSSCLSRGIFTIDAWRKTNATLQPGRVLEDAIGWSAKAGRFGKRTFPERRSASHALWTSTPSSLSLITCTPFSRSIRVGRKTRWSAW